MQVNKQQLEADMEQWTGSKLGKEYVKAVHYHLALFNLHPEYIMQNARLDEVQAGIKIAGENINNLRYADDIHPNGRKQRRTKEPLDESEREDWKSWLKTQHSKTKIMASGPITSWQIDGETVETVREYFFGLQNHEARKDACSLEEKISPT